MKCNICSKENPDGALFCSSCNTKLETTAQNTKQCTNPECMRSDIPSEANFCPSCGMALSVSLEAEEGDTLISDKGNVFDYEHYTNMKKPTPVDLIIPEGFSSIGDFTIYRDSHINSVTIPEGILHIGDGALGDCPNLRRVILPQSLLSIGSGAFQTCLSLESLTIPRNVSNIGGGVFNSCNYLINIRVDSPHFIFENDMLFSADRKRLISVLSRVQGDISIPYGVERIEKNAFYKCTQITSIQFPETLINIDRMAIMSCHNLVSVSLPSSLKELGESAFYYCDKLSHITLPSGLQEIGNYAFKECHALRSMSIPDSVFAVGTNIFDNHILKIHISNNSPVIGIISEEYREKIVL